MKTVPALGRITAALTASAGLLIVHPAAAVDASFTINGTVTSPTPALGYTTGAAVSFTWVLDAAAVSQARFSGPSPSCCSGTLGWTQDLFSSTPQLWKSISGTGLAGNWQPPTNADDGWVQIGAGTFPQPYSGLFGMTANALLGAPSGLTVNGQNVTGLQMTATFLNLDAVQRLGTGTVFARPPPDPTNLFLGLTGTYFVDRTFSDFGSIWANGPGGGQFRFRVDSLTIAAVPEPETWAMLLAGGLMIAGVARRRRNEGARRS